MTQLPCHHGDRPPGAPVRPAVATVRGLSSALYCARPAQTYRQQVTFDQDVAVRTLVRPALQFVASRRQRIEQLLDDPYALGVGPDIADAEIMRQARR
jgi:hypothetical protein